MSVIRSPWAYSRDVRHDQRDVLVAVAHPAATQLLTMADQIYFTLSYIEHFEIQADQRLDNGQDDDYARGTADSAFRAALPLLHQYWSLVAGLRGDDPGLADRVEAVIWRSRS